MNEIDKRQWDDWQRQIEQTDPYVRIQREEREYEQAQQQLMDVARQRAQEQLRRKPMWAIFSRKGRPKS